ncbi:MAG: hypothetical protein J6V07_01750 [Clostridia bacterium]|nr:hypothetical protein [Clostridia bacterium]
MDHRESTWYGYRWPDLEFEGYHLRAWCRPAFGHHPHGLEDPTPLLDLLRRPHFKTRHYRA